MRYLSVAWLLPVLFFAQSAEAARISFATKDCGTPPLLGLEFGINADGLSVLLDPADACEDGGIPIPGIPGDLVDDETGTALYGTSISSLDLTIISGQQLDAADFESGDFFDPSLGFGFSFAPFDSGGGVLSISFDADILLSCTFNPDTNVFGCLNLDLLIFIDGDGETDPLAEGTIVRVTRVNDFTVPEPGTLALLGIGVTAAAVRRRRTTAKR